MRAVLLYRGCKFVRHQVHRIFPGNTDKRAALPEQGIFGPVRSIKNGREVIALNAEEPLVPVVLVSLHSHNLAVAHTGIYTAACAAKPANALYPFLGMGGLESFRQRELKANRGSGSKGRRIFEELSSRDIHLIYPLRCEICLIPNEAHNRGNN